MNPRLVLPALLIATGCGSKSPSAPVATPSAPIAPVSMDVADAEALMPMEVGNTWTYSFRSEIYGGNRLVETKVLTASYRVVARKEGGKAILLLEDEDGNVLDRQGWQATPKGLYQTTAGLKDVPYSPPQPLALFPLKAGQKFSWTGRGFMSSGSTAQGVATAEVQAPLEVDTDSGRMSAIPIVTRTTYSGGRSENTSYFHPGVGLVRYRQETLRADGRREVLVLSIKKHALKRP